MTSDERALRVIERHGLSLRYFPDATSPYYKVALSVGSRDHDAYAIGYPLHETVWELASGLRHHSPYLKPTLDFVSKSPELTRLVDDFVQDALRHGQEDSE